MKRPINKCYWVEPCKLLAGEYPRNPDVASSLRKIAALKAAGVELFIDLTLEREKNWGGVWVEPYAQWVALTEHVRFPIVDGCAPETHAQTIAILDAIDECIAARKIAYVHCLGGVGRTGTIVGCWLARHGGSGSDALTRLATELWPTGGKARERGRSPDRREQRKYVLDWPMHDISARRKGDAW